jgi:hypothetical protein
MGTTLSGTTPQSTYPSLIKVGDNSALSATLKTLSDGAGNDLPIQVSTSIVNFTGNVGIGTTSPTSKLTIAGSIDFSNYNNNLASNSFPLNTAWIESLRNVGLLSDGGGQGIYFKDSGGSAYAKMGFGNLNTTIGQSTFGVVPDLSARLGVRGSGSTSATTSLLVQNSGGTAALQIKDNGEFIIGNTAADFGYIKVPYSPAYGTRTFMYTSDSFPLLATVSNALLKITSSAFYTEGNMILSNVNTGIISQTASQTNNSSIALTTQVNAYNGTSQNDACNCLYLSSQSSILQAGGSINFIKIDGSVNEAGGGGNKWCTGIYYNPTLTGGTLLNNSHYCYHATSGQMMVNTTTPNASAQLQVDSTTRGFLPPRMTTLEKNAIATPASGLMVYDTNLARPCFYNGATWITL